MGLEWVVTGIILLGGMTACGISLFLKRKREAQTASNSFTEIQSDSTEFKEDK
jgi:hypothetical protein